MSETVDPKTAGGTGRHAWILPLVAGAGVAALVVMAVGACVTVMWLSHAPARGPKPLPAVLPAPRPVRTEGASRAGQGTNSRPRLVDLGAGTCIPCKMMAPVLEEMRKSFSNELDVVFVDVWENPKAGESYGISIIPTQIFYDTAGKELFRHEGFYSRDDILAKWKEFGIDLRGGEPAP